MLRSSRLNASSWSLTSQLTRLHTRASGRAIAFLMVARRSLVSLATRFVPLALLGRLGVSSLLPASATAAADRVDALLRGLPSAEYDLTFGAGTHSKHDAPPPPPERVRIYDARGAAERFDLQRDSFELVPVPEYECDMYDGDEAQRVFYPAMEKLLLDQCPGATRVLLFDHLLRNKPRQTREMEEARHAQQRAFGKDADAEPTPKTRFLEAPLSKVHGDYTARSGHSRARQLLAPYCTEEEVEAVLGSESRFALVNVWHHFGPEPVQADPMAFAVWGTFGPRDVMTKRLTFPHRIGETYIANYSPAQRWVHFSAVTRREAILIKTFDSIDDGPTSRFSLHSAFRYAEQDGPRAAEIPVRESIELRALVLYSEAAAGLAPNFSNVSMPALHSPVKVREQARQTELEIYNLVSSELLAPGDEW